MANETVLLVEDETSIRQLMRRMLAEQGYTMLEARNGIEALEVAEAHPTPIHLLLTDVVMPSMDGFTLAARLQALRSKTRVLFLSGHAQDSAKVRDGLEQSRHAFLLKPFTQDALSEKIRDVIDGTDA